MPSTLPKTALALRKVLDASGLSPGQALIALALATGTHCADHSLPSTDLGTFIGLIEKVHGVVLSDLQALCAAPAAAAAAKH